MKLLCLSHKLAVSFGFPLHSEFNEPRPHMCLKTGRIRKLRLSSSPLERKLSSRYTSASRVNYAITSCIA